MRFFILFFISIPILAQDIIWTNNTPIIRTFSSARATDINNDGTEDVIRGGGVDGYPTPYGVIAIDGLSGTTLWSVTTRNEMFTSPQFYDYNNDNINDHFCLSYNGIIEETFYLNIFSRNSDLVYSTNNILDLKCISDGNGWDGRHYKTGNKLPIGTYVYEIYFQDFEGWKHRKTGNIYLIR